MSGALVAWLLVACTGEEEAPPPFQVTFTYPVDGQESYNNTPVRIGFSDTLDKETCGRQALHFAALRADGRVAFYVPYTLVEDDEDNTFELLHDTLLENLTYTLAVQGGELGCLSVGGEPVVPYAITFPVVPRPE